MDTKDCRTNGLIDQRRVGIAKVDIQCLDFYKKREIDTKRLDGLVKLFEDTDCRRHDPDHYIPVVITKLELRNALKASGLTQSSLSSVGEDGTPRWLKPMKGYKFLCLRGHHRTLAAQKALLENDHWWIGEIFLIKSQEELDMFAARWKNDYLHQRQYNDGEVYRHIRRLQKMEGHLPSNDLWMKEMSDEASLTEWRARISRTKQVSVDRIHAHKFLESGLDALLPFPGLWGGLELGNIQRHLALRCDEVGKRFLLVHWIKNTKDFKEISNYLKHIKKVWTLIALQDSELYQYIDMQTVEVLQRRAPGANSTDKQFVSQAMRAGILFPKLDNVEMRDRIMEKLVSVCSLIPSLKSMHENLKYLDTGAKILRNLVLGSDFQYTLNQSLKRIWIPSDMALIQTQGQNFSVQTASVDQSWDFTYKQLWVIALRNFADLGGRAPRVELGRRLFQIETNPRAQYQLVNFAHMAGLRSQAIHKAFSGDLLREHLRISLGKSFQLELKEADKIIDDMMAKFPPEDFAWNPPAFQGKSISNFELNELSRRWGVPFEDAYLRGRTEFFLSNLTSGNAALASMTSVTYIFRDFINAFFGVTPDFEMELDEGDDMSGIRFGSGSSSPLPHEAQGQISPSLDGQENPGTNIQQGSFALENTSVMYHNNNGTASIDVQNPKSLSSTISIQRTPNTSTMVFPRDESLDIAYSSQSGIRTVFPEQLLLDSEPEGNQDSQPGANDTLVPRNPHPISHRQSELSENSAFSGHERSIVSVDLSMVDNIGLASTAPPAKSRRSLSPDQRAFDPKALSRYRERDPIDRNLIQRHDSYQPRRSVISLSQVPRAKAETLIDTQMSLPARNSNEIVKLSQHSSDRDPSAQLDREISSYSVETIRGRRSISSPQFLGVETSIEASTTGVSVKLLPQLPADINDLSPVFDRGISVHSADTTRGHRSFDSSLQEVVGMNDGPFKTELEFAGKLTQVLENNEIEKSPEREIGGKEAFEMSPLGDPTLDITGAASSIESPQNIATAQEPSDLAVQNVLQKATRPDHARSNSRESFFASENDYPQIPAAHIAEQSTNQTTESRRKSTEFLDKDTCTTLVSNYFEFNGMRAKRIPISVDALNKRFRHRSDWVLFVNRGSTATNGDWQTISKAKIKQNVKQRPNETYVLVHPENAVRFPQLGWSILGDTQGQLHALRGQPSQLPVMQNNPWGSIPEKELRICDEGMTLTDCEVRQRDIAGSRTDGTICLLFYRPSVRALWVEHPETINKQLLEMPNAYEYRVGARTCTQDNVIEVAKSFPVWLVARDQITNFDSERNQTISQAADKAVRLPNMLPVSQPPVTGELENNDNLFEENDEVSEKDDDDLNTPNEPLSGSGKSARRRHGYNSKLKWATATERGGRGEWALAGLKRQFSVESDDDIRIRKAAGGISPKTKIRKIGSTNQTRSSNSILGGDVQMQETFSEEVAETL